MSHTDVVPVEEEEKWKFPPFSAQKYDGRIYGRGASDCKGLLAAQIMAMRLIKRNNIQLRDSLILCSGADEEHGGRYGFGWLAENHPDKITAPFAVNEGGGTPIEAAGALTYILGVGEKGRLQIEFTVKGISAHASVPWQGTNALYRLSQVLGRIENYEAERDTSTSLFAHLSSFAIEHPPSPENVDEIIEEVREDNPRFASMLTALSRMTITPTMINGGVKSNSVPEQINLTCDVRDPASPERRLPARRTGQDNRGNSRRHLRNRLHGRPQLVRVRYRADGAHTGRDRARARTRRHTVGPRDKHRIHRLSLHPSAQRDHLRLLRLPPRRRPHAESRPRDRRVNRHSKPHQRHQDYARPRLLHLRRGLKTDTTVGNKVKSAINFSR